MDSRCTDDRWTARRRMDLVLAVLRGETSVAEASAEHGLAEAEVEAWRARFLRGAESALREPWESDCEPEDEAIQRLRCRIRSLIAAI